MKKLFVLVLTFTLVCTYQTQAQDKPEEKKKEGFFDKVNRGLDSASTKTNRFLGGDKSKTEEQKPQPQQQQQAQPQKTETPQAQQPQQPKAETPQAQQPKVEEKPTATMVKQKTDLEKLGIKGNVASVTETSGNYKAVYNFNQSGMFTSIDLYNKFTDGKSATGTIKFIYNDKGQLEKREINCPHSLLGLKLYEAPIDKIEFQGASVGSETFKYDPTGKLIERNVSIKWQGTQNTSKMTYKYDTKGQLINIKTNSSVGEMSDWNYVYDAAGNLEKAFMGEIDDYPWGDYKYNSKNQLISKQDEGSYSPTKLEYNETGDCIKKNGKDDDGGNVIQSYTYTYDAQKNWTKKVEAYSDEYGKGTFTTNRIIVYNQ